ncbi:hypothetical protein [Ignatzschineria sp. LJL83]
MSKQSQNHSHLHTSKSNRRDQWALIMIFGTMPCTVIWIGFHTANIVAIFAGLVILAIMIVSVYWKFIRRVKSVISTGYGQAIETQFLELKRELPKIAGSQPAFRIRTQWIDVGNNKLYHFLSQDIFISDLHYLYTYPEYLSAELKSAMITVMINPDDPKKYYFDDAEILRIINQFITPNLEKTVPILKKKEWEKMQKALEAEVQKIQRNQR